MKYLAQVKEISKILLYLMLIILVFRISRAVNAVSYQAQVQIKSIGADIHDLHQNIDSSLIDVGLVLDQVNANTSAQINYWNNFAMKSNDSLDRLNLLVKNTDQNLNAEGTGLLPMSSKVLLATANNLTESELALVGDVDKTQEEIAPILENLKGITGAARDNLASPDIPEIEHNLMLTSASVASTADHAEKSTADVQAWVHREFAPVKGTFSFIKSLIFPGISAGANVATAVR